MRYFYIALLIIIPILYSCDDNSGSRPMDVVIACSTPEDVSESSCPASELTNMCTTYSCHFMTDQVIADSPFPPCPGDANSCEFVDCTTLMCGDSLYYGITASEGSLDYSFDSLDSLGQPIEVNVMCHEFGLFDFTCGEDGTIFN